MVKSGQLGCLADLDHQIANKEKLGSTGSKRLFKSYHYTIGNYLKSDTKIARASVRRVN